MASISDRMIPVTLEEEMASAYLDYSMSVIVSRALPDVRDGLKPVHRRVLYAMSELGLSPNRPYKKSARIVGETMGKYHPHGDQAIYDSLVRMAQDFSMRHELVDGQGNWGCFTGETKITLLDGTEKSFAELAELDPTTIFHVFSVNKEGRVVVGEGRNSRITRRDAELVEVVLDNGASIRCTPDHRFMLRDGTYKEAQYLTPDDSLMAGYFDAVPVKAGLNEYLRIQQPDTGEFEFVHHLADTFNAERGLAESFNGPFVRHHKNFNRWDNRPENIQRMDFLEHLHLHAEHISELWESEEFRTAQREGVRRYYAENPEAQENNRRRLIERNKSEEFRQANGPRVSASLKALYQDPERRRDLSDRMKSLWADPSYREKMSQALKGIEKRPLTIEESERVARIISEKSRAMWANDEKRDEIIAAIRHAMTSDAVREKISDGVKRAWLNPEFRAKYPVQHFSHMAEILWQDPMTRDMHREKIAKQWQEESFRTAQRDGVKRSNERRLQDNPEMMKQMAEKSSQALREAWKSPEYRQQVMRQRIAKYGSDLIAQFGKEGVTPDVYLANRNATWIPKLETTLKYYQNFNDFVEASSRYNHRIVEVKRIDERADVYDITVDIHHNFLLADGVFVHNSVDGDPAAAMRYCVTGDTLVVTDKGLQRIDALSPEKSEDVDLKILSMSGAVNTASKWFDCGAFPTMRVRTRRGYEVTGTTNHPLLVCTQGPDKRVLLVWKTVDTLKKGDWLVLDRSRSFWPTATVPLSSFHPTFPDSSRVERHQLPTEMTDELAFLLGALVAEGTCRDNVIEFTNTEGDFADEFVSTWEKVFPTCRLHIFRRKPNSYGKKPFLQMQIVSTQVIAFLNNLGLRGRSVERMIPETILRSSRSIAGSFLRGVYEGDGSVERSGKSLLRVGLCAKSRPFLAQVQTLLLRFGIVASLGEEVSRGTHRLMIVGRTNLTRFLIEVGFVSEVKSRALAEAIDCQTGRALSKTDYVPYLSEFVRANAQRGHREWLSRHNFDRPERLVEALPILQESLSHDDFEQVARLAESRYLFDQVTEIDDAGEQPVYSIRVDSQCHSFVANGFVNHNTEARLTWVALEMLRDIDKNTVDFIPNFDDSLQQPSVLPSIIPNLLVNGAGGIAVGMATNIPPHNMGEIVDGLMALSKDPDIPIEKLIKHVKAPDFPTGGIIYGYDGVKEAYTTGRGRIVIRARVNTEQLKSGRDQIIITELPYQVNKATLIEKIAELVRMKKIEDISNIRDESDRDGMRVVIELKRDSVPEVVLNNLYKQTSMQSTFGVIMLALVKGRPRVLNLKEMMFHFLEHRNEVVVRRTRFDLEAAERRAHILEGYIIALDNIDAVIETIKKSKDAETARRNLMKKFSLSEIQAKAILDMRLQRLTGLEREKIVEEYRDILKLIEQYKSILASPELQMQIIRDELKGLKEKYANERRTEIVANYQDFTIEDMIAEEDMVVTISHNGYIKRFPVSGYRRQNRGGKGVTGMKTYEDDFIEHVFVGSTHHHMIFFTDKGRCFRRKIYELPEAQRAAKGRSLANLLNIEKGEKVNVILSLKDFDTEESIIMVTKSGTVKKTLLRDYSNIRTNGIIAINLRDDDKLVAARVTDGTNDILIGSYFGNAVRFQEEGVRDMGRTATGVRGITLAKGDYVIEMIAVKRADATVLVASEKGYGKRSRVDDFRLTRRGGKGVIAMNTTAKTGKVIALKEVVDGDDLMLMTEGGMAIRQHVSEIRVMGRNTQGVRLIRLKDGDRLTGVAVVPVDEDAEVTPIDETVE